MNKNNKIILSILGAMLIPVAGIGAAVLVINNKDENNPKTLDGIKTELQNLIDKNDILWVTKESLQTEIDTKYGIGEITVKDIIRSGEQSEQVSFLGNGTKKNHFKYKDTLQLEHTINIEKKPIPISKIAGDLGKLINDDQTHKNQSWVTKDLQILIDKTYSNGGITVEPVQTLTSWKDNSETFVFSADGDINKNHLYCGSTDPIIHSFQTYQQDDIQTIIKDLTTLINGKGHKEPWSLARLNEAITAKYPNGGISATFVINEGITAFKDQTQGFKLTADGKDNHNHNFFGTIDQINYQYKMDKAIDIKLITDDLKALLNDEEHKHRSWTTEGLNATLFQTYPNGGIRIGDIESVTSWKDGSEQYVFTAVGNEDNGYDYYGSTEPITHDCTINEIEPIGDIQDELEDIVYDENHIGIWDIESLKEIIANKYPNGGISAQVVGSDTTIGMQLILFTGDADNSNGHDYNGESNKIQYNY